MQFAEPLVQGTLLKREKRFSAAVKLDDGEEVTAHCANPGSLHTCFEPGSRVLLSISKNPRRRHRHQVEIVYNGHIPVGIHSARPHSILSEAIVNAKIPEFFGYATMQRDAKYGRDERADLLLDGNGLRPCYIDIRNLTWAEDGIGYFPDTELAGADDHFTNLTNLVREGNRAVLAMVALREDVTSVRPADRVDPEFGEALRDAVARGVELLCFRARITEAGMEFDQIIPSELTPH